MFVKIINSDRKKSPSISTLLKMLICTRLLNRTKHESSCINVNCTQLKANTKKKFSTPLSKNKNFSNLLQYFVQIANLI